MTLVFESLEELRLPEPRRPVHLAVGTFDGLHEAHAALIGRCAGEAHATGAIALVFTFRNHPREIIAPAEAPRILTPWALKRRLIERVGVDVLVGIEFDRAFASIEARDFVADVLVGRCGAKVIHSGRNFRFGRMGYGTPALLEEMAEELGYRYEAMPPIKLGGARISSSRIRAELERGNPLTAARIMGRPHQVTGRVKPGDGIGSTIGFPTANMNVDPLICLPADGVYAVMAFTAGETTPRPAMMNIGNRPTVGGLDHRLEVHLIGYEGNLLGAELTVQFFDRLREERKFSGLEELAAQLERDRERSLEVLRGVRTERY